jgi:hypothetical protein
MNLNTTFTVSAVQAAARTAAGADLATPLRCPLCANSGHCKPRSPIRALCVQQLASPCRPPSAPTALLSIRLGSRNNFHIPNPIISRAQFFSALKTFERVWVTKATLRNGLVDSAAIACNPAHLGSPHVTRSIDFLVLLQCGSRRRRILFVHDHRPLQ